MERVSSLSIWNYIKLKKNAFSVERPAMSGKHCHVTVLPSSTKFILDGVVLLSNIVKVDTVNM